MASNPCSGFPPGLAGMRCIYDRVTCALKRRPEDRNLMKYLMREAFQEVLIDEPDYEWLMIDRHCKVHPHATGG